MFRRSRWATIHRCTAHHEGGCNTKLEKCIFIMADFCNILRLQNITVQGAGE